MLPPIVASAGLLLVHVPPVGVLDKVVVRPTHTSSIPDTGAGVGLTVNDVVVKHPVGNV